MDDDLERAPDRNLTATPLAHRLRSETAPAHQALEQAVGFDIHRADLAVGKQMLMRFYRVLQVLEPAMLALLPQRLRERTRLALLVGDLHRLGLDAACLAKLRPPAQLFLPQTMAQAMGALYVLEGSTLGGKVIVKALRRLPDWPLSGRCYFDPYEDATKEMWMAFQAELAQVADHEADAVILGANRTFQILHEVLAEGVAA